MSFKFYMNITPVNIKSYTPNFKSYTDDCIIGFDDSISQKRRNFIREHYNSWHMPYHSIYNSEHKLTDYQMKILIENFEKYHDIQKINGTNIYRGQTLVDKPEYIETLKTKGIKTIIDLVGYGKTYEEEVNKSGLDYYSYNIYENWWNITDIKPIHVNKLVDFLKKMQEDNIYIACQHGANDTDIAFILNDFFNPFLEGKAKTTIPASDSDFPIKLNTIYDMLSNMHKKMLGWDKEFEQRLIKKLISI